MNFEIFNLRNTILVITLWVSSFNWVFGQCPTVGAVITKVHTDVSCFGANDGTITVELGDGSAPLNFELWDNNLGTFATLSVVEDEDPDEDGNFRKVTYSGVYPSSFQVLVFKSGCPTISVSETPFGTVISEPTALSVTYTVTSDCDATLGSGTGTIDLSVSGGTSPYTIEWTGPTAVPDNTVSATNLDAGIYSVVVTDGNNCTDTQNIDVPLASVADAGDDQNVCADNTTLAGNSPAAGETGTWSLVSGSGTITDPSSPTSTVTGLAFGNNVFEWTIQDSGMICPASTDQVTITRDAPATVDAGADQTICSGSTAGLSGAFGGSASSVVWSSSGDGTFDDETSPTAVYTPGTTDVGAGSVTLTLSTDDPAGACPSVSDNVVITIDGGAVVDAGPDQTICSDGTATLAGSFSGSATSATWTSSGDGSFDDPTLTNAIYTPGPGDITAETVTLTFTTDDPAGPCGPASDDVVIAIAPATTANAGSDQTICEGTTAGLSGSIGGMAGSSIWTTSGDGTFDDATSVTAIYTPGSADITSGSVTLTLTTDDPSGPCVAASDDMVITIEPAATVEAGAAQTICSDGTATLAGSFSGSATSATWTSSGDGSFDDPTLTNAIYTPGPGDITAETVTLTFTTDDPAGPCGPVSDDVVIAIEPATTANAGTDQTICEGMTAGLSGSIGGMAGSSSWTTSGDGTFDNATSLTAIYTPGSADITSGSVTLTLTTDDPSGPCVAASDDVVITIEPAATVEAGAAQTICSDGAATLAGSFGGSATSATWTSSGDGGFDDPTLTNAIYTPGLADITAGTVTLTFTTDDPAGPCGPASDNVVIAIEPATTANAGADQIICEGTTAGLSGSIGGMAGSSTWTTSGDGTFDDATSLTAIYTPGSADITSGNVTLTLTTDDPAGPCVAASDDVLITIDAGATVDAGAAQTICAGSTATLAGTFAGAATSATWTTSGDGSFDDPTSGGAVYTPGLTDISNGNVTLTFTTDDPAGPCLAVSDNVVITIDPTPIVDAGPAQTVCSGSTVSLAGTIGGSASSANWTTSGDGTFDNATSLTAIYTPGTADVGAGTVTLTLTTDDPTGPCVSVNDNVVITIDAGATVDAGAAQTICAGSTATLAGIFGGTATSATWTTSGDGSFDDPTSGGAIYTPGTNDISNGSVTLTYTTDDPPGVCEAVADAVVITIVAEATVDAGADQTICNGGTAALAGSFTGSTGITWTTSGDGAFDDASLVNAVYTPGPNDTSAGTVMLTITTAGPCAPVSDDVVVTIIDAPTVDAGSPQTICSSASIVLNGSFGGSATGLLWSTSGDGVFDDNTDPNASYTPGANDASLGSVTLTATATGSCAGTSDDVVITIDPAATIDAGSPQGACDGSAANLNATLGGAATSMTWTTSGDGTFSSNTDPQAQYTPGPNDLANGLVTLTATTNNPAGPCPAVSDIVEIATTVEVTTMNASACENGSTVDLLTLASGTPPGGTFTFTGPGVTGNLFDPSGQSGTVDITVEYDLYGCTDNGTLQITVLTSSDPLCGGGNCESVVIVPKTEPATCTNSDGRMVMSIDPFYPAVNNTGVKITIDGVSSTGLTITRTIYNDSTFEDLPVGHYDYEIEYGDPSCIKTGTFSIDQSGTVGTPVASDIVSPVCPGTATGSLTLDVPGETGNVLEWSLDAGLSDPFKPFTAGGRISGIPAGPAPTFQQVISVRRDVSDVCYSSVTITMTESVTAVSATFNVDAATCNGNDGAITDIVADGGNGGPYTFSIDGGVSFQTAEDFNGLAGGEYTLRVRDEVGCSNDFAANVTFPGFINFDITKSNADCSNDGNSGAISVTVNDPGTFQVALTTDQFNAPAENDYISYTSPAVSFTELPRGEYFVYVKSGDVICPTRSALIDIFGVYDVSFGIEADCNNNELSLVLVNVTGEAGGAPLEIQISRKFSSDPPEIIYEQFPADGEIYLDHDQYVFLQTPGEYRVQIIQFQSEVVCNLPSDILDFAVPTPLNAGIGPVAESYPDVPSGKLSVVNFSGGIYPYDVRIELDSASSFSLPYHATEFEEAGLNSNQQIEMSYDEIPAGRYIVQVQDSLGCILDLTARVPLDVDLYIPNVFTPNGDGSNDVFFIRNLPLEGGSNELVITNRWGKEVFVSENYQNNWDGTGAADGIYFYRLQVADNASLTGWIEVIRGPKP